MSEVLIFGGTTEGRELAEFCAGLHIPAVVSVATRQGAERLPDGTAVHCGRMDVKKMQRFIGTMRFSIVIDATHPYAREATANIRRACAEIGIPYYRLIRKNSDISGEIALNTDELIRRMNAFDGVILSTLGSKSLEAMTRVHGFAKRLWVRVLPTPEITEYCESLGYEKAHVITGQPPFSVEENLRHIRMSGARLLITKDSGDAGGYPEKADAVKKAGIRMLTLTRPPEEGLSIGEIKKLLREWNI